MESANPYAAPAVDVAASDREAGALGAGAPFVVFQPSKLLALSVATFNLYPVVWHYRQWAHLKRRHPGYAQIWPVARAIFSVFFVHDLFRLIRGELVGAGIEPTGDARSRATLYVVVSIAGNALSRVTDFGGLVGLLGLFPILTEQREIIRLHEATGRSTAGEGGWTGWSFVALAVGVIIWALVLASPFLPEG